MMSILFSGCRSCALDSSGVDPRQYLPTTAEAVMELSDIADLPRLRALLTARLKHVVPEQDVARAQEELKLMLGFDPLTVEGLAEAGLPPTGRVAGAVRGDTSLWIFPVKTPAKTRAAIERLVQSRATAERQTEKVAGVEVDVYVRAFGAEEAIVAAWAARGGLSFLAVGPAAKTQVTQALSQAPETSLLKDEGYTSLVGRLSRDWHVRAVFLKGGEGLRDVLERMGRTDLLSSSDAAIDNLERAGWTLRVGQDGFHVDGRLDLLSKARAATQKILSGVASLSKPVRAIAMSNAAMYMILNINTKAALEVAEKEADHIEKARINRYYRGLGFHSGAELASVFSGQAGWAFGLQDLAQFELAHLMQIPPASHWSALAFGLQQEADVHKLSGIDVLLKSEGYESEAAKVGGHEVELLKNENTGAGIYKGLSSGALVYANRTQELEALLKPEALKDPLNGKPGFAWVFNLSTFAEQLSTFPVGRLPLFFRSIASRALDTTAAIDVLKFSVEPAKEGLSLRGTLLLAPVPDE